jgi:hypothetical protein
MCRLLRRGVFLSSTFDGLCLDGVASLSPVMLLEFDLYNPHNWLMLAGRDL